eukprot:Mycagemm_TRINITY_DN10280_c0_g2::TRINITY_DN10280_c0_g2_i1::g.3757::m.3757 type:complete len:135 gc:universal TRINITY_DN10280_c0_g2_i1:515-919(+)
MSGAEGGGARWPRRRIGGPIASRVTKDTKPSSCSPLCALCTGTYAPTRWLTTTWMRHSHSRPPRAPRCTHAWHSRSSTASSARPTDASAPATSCLRGASTRVWPTHVRFPNSSIRWHRPPCPIWMAAFRNGAST